MKIRFVGRLIALGLATLAAGAQAQVGTGTLSGWAHVGDVASQDGSLWLSTAFVDGVDDGGGLPFSGSAVDIGSVEAAAGVAPYALDLAPGDHATEGSLASQTFSAIACQTLSFRWTFSTAETWFEDHAFVVINGVTSTLASRSMPGATVNTFSRQIAQDGPLTLAFGVVDTQDFLGVSILRVDSLHVAMVPEPAQATLLLAGLGAVFGGAALRRQQRPVGQSASFTKAWVSCPGYCTR